MWFVDLIKAPKQNDFRKDFFPRKVRYKADARKLVEEIERKSGKATIRKS